ncbi:hypothetical protein A6770_31300 [Nostoc minutum NIES-26]|uniref:Uncharacterized protein n=1 Tax=Nostoc minutum NIES-26 TaxID=1844469 RepID=A0A367Q969_9NOSO|nr:hypothetical protein A6770_31300 [Nostoc minutum NIES-26]
MSAIVINPSTQQLERVQGKTWIVLVGVNHYQDHQILDLRYCANDCKELADTLKIVTQQFQETEIIALYDGGDKPPNKLEINNSIQIFRLAKPEDTVLFYFSGHGYLDSNNRPILCVTDTNLEDLAETGLKLDTLLNELRQCKAQRQLVWLDACQERERQQDDIIRQNPTGQLLAVLEQQAEQSQDFYAMLSCNKTERSWEIPELKHGLFTYCLIEGLRGKAANTEGKIDADTLFKYVERSSKKFIEYKKNPLSEHSFSKGMLGNLKEYSNKLKVKQLPLDASQTPQRIARGSGELIIGLATFSVQRKAVIIDNLSSSLVNISLCKILKARGNFEVDYCFVREKQRRNIQQIITSCLQEKSNQTVFLYLAGTIEFTNPETYELICNHDNRINLNWLGQQLQDSPVKEIVIIADILDTSETNKSLVEILQPSQDKSLCLITFTSSVANNKKLLHELVTVLETAGELEREFWVAELVTQLKKWGASQGNVNFNLWLSGSTEVIDILSVEAQRSYNEIFEINVCPYKSLEAFTQDDAYFFHGREELIAEIIDKLQSTSFLAVVGASGSGKSSVVRAGVIPQLVTEGLFDSELEQSKSCQSWVMLPGDNPLAALAKTLAPYNPDFLEGVLHLGVDSLVEWLRQQPKEISVLVIDQFEELFTLTAETDRVNFLSLILGAIKKAGNYFKVIITLRSDFLDECLGMIELAPLITKSQVLVPSCRLEDEQYRQIIAKPAQKVGLEVEDGLIALLLEELKDGSLPLLQYALEELWHKRSRGKLTVKDYQQHIGKLGKFLSNKAQETYNNLSEAQQECAQSIFLSLVFLVKEQEDSNKDTRRRLPISELLIDKYKDVLDSTLQALINARLIVVSGEENNLSLVNQEQLNGDNDEKNRQINNLDVAARVDGENINSQNKDKVTVEIAHEILLRDWETLKWWLDENREKYRLIKEINQKADEWKQNGKLDGFLLSNVALAKFEEFYVKYADDLSTIANQFFQLSIDNRDFLKQKEETRRQKELEQERKARINAQKFIWTLLGGLVAALSLTGLATWQLRRATINEINALINSKEAFLASNQEFDALVAGLKAGRRIKNSFFGVDPRTKMKLTDGLQNVFYRVKEFNRLEGHTRAVVTTAFSPDGQIIASTSIDNTVKLWNQQGKLLHNLQDHTGITMNVALSPDGQIIASTSLDNTVKLWNQKGKLLHTFKVYTKDYNGFLSFLSFSIPTVTFSPDGQIIATVSHRTVQLWNLEGHLLHTLEGHLNMAMDAAFSPDGQIIATAGEDKTVKLWNLQGQLLRTLEGHTNTVNKVKFSPDGLTIASASTDNTVKLWNLQGQLLRTLEDKTNVVFSPDGLTIASAGENKTVKLWNLQGQLLRTIKINTSDYGTSTVIFSPDNQIIASTHWNDNTVKLWNLQGQLLHTLSHTDNLITSVVFSPDSQTIASVNSDKVVRLWNWKGQLLRTLEGHSKNIRSFKFNPNGKIITSISDDNTVKVWNQQGQLLNTITDNNANSIAFVNSVVFSPDGLTIASINSINRNKTIKLQNLQGQLLHTLEGHTDYINQVTFSPDGSTIASASTDNTVKLWNLQGQLLRTLEGHADDVTTVNFSPDGSTIASASRDNTVKLWNPQGQLIRTLEDNSNNIKFSPNGQMIASASTDNTVKLWNLQGQLLYTFKRCIEINNIEFSPDSQTVAFASSDEIVKLWNLEGRSLNKIIDCNYGKSVVFSPDGQTVASISRGNTIQLFNRQGQLLHTLEGHRRKIEKIVFSPDGQKIASASEDKKVKVWNLQGELLYTFEGHASTVNSILFSPDSKTLASTSFNPDNTIKLWSLDFDEVMARGCDWARDYLTNNPNVSEEDRKICDGIGNK